MTSLAGLQGVPLTLRNISESFWVLTGTTKNHQLSSDVKKAVSTDATLVILMAIRKLQQIAQLLMESGRGYVPMMIIENGSKEEEKVHPGTVFEFREGLKITGPGIIIVGVVVALHQDFIHSYAMSEWL